MDDQRGLRENQYYGFSPAHKPAHSWSQVSAIEESLEKIYKGKHGHKLQKAAKIKPSKKNKLGLDPKGKPPIQIDGILVSDDLI